MREHAKEVLRVYPEGDRLVILVPNRRGEELRVHLASHGITASLTNSVDRYHERLEVERGADAETLQTILDHWER
jgi:hypothetical protein